MSKVRMLLAVSVVIMMMAVLFTQQAISQTRRLPQSKTEEQQKIEEMEVQAEQAAAEEQQAPANVDALAAKLPADTTPRYAISQFSFSGNTMISSEALLSGMPDVYDAAGGKDPAGMGLFDFRTLKTVAAQPGTAVEVSARSIQGFTQYLLAQYQKKGYAGIYIYVPSEAFEPGKELSQGILPIRVLEATVASVGTAYYDVNNQPVEKGNLRPEVLTKWSPAQPGGVFNNRELDNYLNLLNLNPDRYIAGVVSRGEEPNSLAINYRVYEANPWHFFVQIDNSGTDDTQWTPRFGFINTNLLGYDDRLTVVYQAVPDSTWNEEFAVYGSYDFPIFSPRLRLNVFGGYNEFDIAGGDINFLGRGTFAGGTLKYNLFQMDKWFFDVFGTITHDESKSTPDLFPEFLASDVHLTMGGFGAQLYRTSDMADSFFSFTRMSTLDGSPQDEFYLARTNCDRDVVFYNTIARHGQFVDTNKIQRVTGSLQWISTEDRLPPMKMTSFGGMYTVRGYQESDTVADNGIIASLQYEYDLVRHSQVGLWGKDVDQKQRKPFLKKFAPLAFVDYGRASYESPEPSEHNQELCSVGSGFIVELGNNFTGTMYYGYPLKATDETGSGQGRLHAGLIFRW